MIDLDYLAELSVLALIVALTLSFYAAYIKSTKLLTAANGPLTNSLARAKG